MLDAVEDAAVAEGLTVTSSSSRSLEASPADVDLSASCVDGYADVAVTDTTGGSTLVEVESLVSGDERLSLSADFDSRAKIDRDHFVNPSTGLGGLGDQTSSATAPSGRSATVKSDFDIKGSGQIYLARLRS